MSGLAQIKLFRSFFTLGPYEKDPGFRRLLTKIAREGMLVYGVLGSFILILYVSAYIFWGGKTISWDYTGVNPSTEILLLDKSLILVLCLVMIPLSRTRISLNWMRVLVFVLVWLICMAMLMDDLATRDVSFTTAYTTVALLVAVATVPYTGWQTALLSGTVIISTMLVVQVVPEMMGIGPLELEIGQEIYISVIAVLLTGTTSMIYLNRYEQYRARKRAEDLSKKLEERAEILKAMKEKSDKQAEHLLENEKLKDRFFANISHEFRTPLTVILGPLKDLLQGNDAESHRTVSRELLGLMYRNGKRLLELINQLLDLSKIDAGEIDLNKEPVNLSEFIPGAVRAFIPFAESRQVKLSCTVTEKPVIVNADLQQMERVISNLVSNAIKFTPAGGSVTVSVSQVDSVEETVQLKVHDTGIGIPAGELPHIFDRFYQGAYSTDSLNPGTGIGLALVKEIVELHGGTIRVQSKPGSGSTFTVELHSVPEPAGETASGDEELPFRQEQYIDGEWDEYALFLDGESGEIAEDAPTVLLVDDNPDLLAYLRPWLSRRYNVIATEQSDEALKLIRERSVNLVISDVRMPPPDGFELCRVIKEDPKLNHIPVILLTAQTQEESRIEGLELGADDYISKPFSAAELMVRVENLIELRQLLQKKYSQQVNIKGRKVEVTSEDARFLKQVQSVIESNMDNTNFSVDWLADEVHLSSRQLQRKIHAITDLSVGGYIRLLRLERASQLLSQHWGNVSEISYKVGFQDTRYFSRLFKQAFGVTPSKFAER